MKYPYDERKQVAINGTFTVPADRLKDNDLIEINGTMARIVSSYEWGDRLRTKIIRSLETGIESIEIDPKELVVVHVS